jgi:DNA-binding winged helix-turn-helix (wHTH) protein
MIDGGRQTAVYNPAWEVHLLQGDMVTAIQKILRFGVFELNLDTEELRRSETSIKLAPQPFRLLAILASHAGQIVTREEIKEHLWGEETYVDFEQGMNQCIRQIRTVLGDNADNPLYVETLPRRGYRFLAPVVSKNVLAPTPRIIKSQSGIRSDVIRTPGSEATPIASRTDGAPPMEAVATAKDGEVAETNVAGKDERTSARVSSAGPSEPVARGESPAPHWPHLEATSAAAAAQALAPEIARLRESPHRTRRMLVWVLVVVAALVAAVLYLQLQRP